MWRVNSSWQGRLLFARHLVHELQEYLVLSFIPFPCHLLHSFTLFTISFPLHSYHILFLPSHSILTYLLLFLHLHPSFIFDIPVASTSFNSIGISLLMSLGDCLCQLNLSHWFKIVHNSCKILGKRMADHLWCKIHGYTR